MRRLLVPFALTAALSAVPAAADPETCVGFSTHGTAIPNTETDFTCSTVPTSPPLGWYCEFGYEGVYPDAWIEHHFCIPSV